MSPRPQQQIKIGDTVRVAFERGIVVGHSTKRLGIPVDLAVDVGNRVILHVRREDCTLVEYRSNITREINAFYRRNGLNIKVVRERSGYFYFTGSDAAIGAESVHVYRANHLNVDEWIVYALSAIDVEGWSLYRNVGTEQ